MFRRSLLSIIICVAFNHFGYSQDDFCNQLQALSNLVTAEHYQPKPIDDSLSSGVFDIFISRLDSEKRLFIKEDIERFQKDKYNIDNYINDGQCAFIQDYISTLQSRVDEAIRMISALEDNDLDYSGRDTIYFKPDRKVQFVNTVDRLKDFWSKRIRYNILFELIERDSVPDNIKKDFKALEADVKSKVIQQEICKLNELQNRHGSLKEFVEDAFLNAYLAYHDPNSLYFNDSEKTTYVNSLSNDQLSFGIITSKNENGNIIIADITSGSPAFLNGNFETNDVIKSLESNGDILETFCVSNEDVLAFTNDAKHNTVTFNIKKKNGTLKSITLTKSITKIEDNTVVGYLLEEDEKIGYISINNFYSDFESPNGLGVANDVAKELYKLQKENIKGLIIDLRFNGGGSMKEASDLSGMFINRGPLSIIKYSNEDLFTVRDINRGALFMKPIVVLVNGFSASASEFFAAAMQDYNRAVIVGTPTYGKASAQSILPLSESSELGFSKLTIEKFYRITGKSHQSQGVIPDVQLPNLYDNFKTEEKYSAHALKNDSVTPILSFVKLKELPLQELQELSTQRVNESEPYKAIKELNQLILQNYFELETNYTLTLDNVYKSMNDYRSEWEVISSKLYFENKTLNVTNTDSTDEILSYSETQKAVNDAFIEDIKGDIYISEAHNIMKDLLQINSNN